MSTGSERKVRTYRPTEFTVQDEQDFIESQDALQESYVQACQERYVRQQEEYAAWRQWRYEERVQAEQEFRERRETNPERWYVWYREQLKQVFLPFNPFREYLRVDWGGSSEKILLIPQEGVRLFREATFSQEAFDGSGSIFRLILPSGEEEIFVVMEPKFEDSWQEEPRPYELQQIKEGEE